MRPFTTPTQHPNTAVDHNRVPGRLRRLAAVGLPVACLGGLSAAAAVHGTYEIIGLDTVKYTYRLDNRTGAFDIAAWSLDLDLPSPDWDPLDIDSGGEVSMPNENWIGGPGIPVAGRWAQDFLSLSSGAEVLIGEELDGFWFLSHFLPGEVQYQEFSSFGDSAAGFTIGPAIPYTPVPETGIWAAGAVLGGFAAATCRRRRSSRVTH